MFSIIFIVLNSGCIIGTVGWISCCRSRTRTVLFPRWGITSCGSGLWLRPWVWWPPWLGLRLNWVRTFLTAVAAGMWSWRGFRLNNPVCLRWGLPWCLLTLWWTIALSRGCWRGLGMGNDSVSRRCLLPWVRLDWSGGSRGWSGRGARPVSCSWLWWGCSVGRLLGWGRSWCYLSRRRARSCWCRCWVCLLGCWSSCLLVLRCDQSVTIDVTLGVISLRITSCVVWTIIINRLNENGKSILIKISTNINNFYT